MDFNFFMPAHIIFGMGKLEQIGVHAESIGKRAMIVTGRESAKKAGFLDTVCKALENQGVEWVLFDEVESNPLTTTVERGGRIAAENKVDMVIGLGGGSAMDTAKGAAFMALNEGSMADYMEGKPGGDVLPIILISTTAGTGSEANNNMVLTNPVTTVKKSFKTSKTYSKISIVDPELTVTVPKRVTAYTGIDVFFHAMEAFVGKRNQPISDALALEAIRLVAKNLLGAYEEGHNLRYREPMAWANTLAGMAINHAGTCGIHGMGHSLGGVFDIAHGESLSAVCLAFMRYNIPAAPERFSRVAEAMGMDIAGLSVNKAAEKALEGLEQLLDNLNLHKSLSELGIERKHVDMLAEHAFRSSARSFKASPREYDLDDVKRLFRESF